MHRRQLHLSLSPCASLVLLSALSCSAERGVLVAISGESAAELELVVGLERDGIWLVDDDSLAPPVDVRGRNLRSDPYRIWLHPPEGSAPARVQLIARAWREEDDGRKRISAVGVMAPPQGFIEGELLRRTVRMRGLGDQVQTSSPNGCFSARIDEESWLFQVAGNLDCDPVRADAEPADCDDQDGDRYPGSPELCDGRDNSCDAALGPEDGICFALAGGAGPCRIGTRFCERTGQGAGECRPGDEAAPEAFCARFERCARFADPRPCLEGFRRRRRCVLERDEQGAVCGGARLVLDPPREAESCRWVIFASGGLPARFANGSQESGACTPTLDLSDSPEPISGNITIDFFAAGEAGWLVDLELTAETVESCEGRQPPSCK